ncbi:MAG: hypothetical protein JWO93_1273 [Micrococcaceae bacterium]|nr:hypothetical protein [Micrococcaceae bacterium]
MSTTTEAGKQPKPQGRIAAAGRWFLTHDRIIRIAVLAAYVVLVLTGATTSSIGMPHLREDPGSPLGTEWGGPRGIRSDEYNAFSPIALSVMATGGAPTLSPLGARADLVHRFSSGGFFESIVFFDAQLLKTATFLPDSMVFAAHWWLPMLLFLLFLPTWFAQLGASRRLGWLAAGLIALSPSVAWWSQMPVALMAYTVTGCSLMLSAYTGFRNGRRVLPWLLAVVGGVLLAGIPTFYTPWSLVLGLPVLVASVAWILTRIDSWWSRIRPVLVTGVVAAVLGAGTLLENASGLQALLETVYPGSRRSSGTAQPLALLFGAPFLNPLQQGVEPTGINASEISTSFTLCFAWLLVLLATARFTRQWRDHVATGTVLFFAAVWLAWTTVNFGPAGDTLPLLNYVTPPRAAQVVGILAVLAVCLLLSAMTESPPWRAAVVAGLSVAALSAYAGSQLQQGYLPGLQLYEVLVPALAAGTAVMLVTRFPRNPLPMVLALVLAALPVWAANPVIFGLGDLRASDTARELFDAGKQAREGGEVWASDLGPFDTVLLANGVPSLSGLQRSGPDQAMWKALDPDNKFESAWNRGGGYVPFHWTPGAETQITTNGFDTTFVAIDPCVLAREVPNLSHVASTVPLSGSCLSLEKELEWAGQTLSVYRTD